MLRIGLTGNIGSGKTTVTKVFEVLGIPVFYADEAAKNVMVTDITLIKEIKSFFGTASYHDDGTLNRKHLAAIAFSNDEQLARLNAIVHPATFRAFNIWVKTITGVPYILKEAALLFESDSYKMCDSTIVVTAPLEHRIKRVMERDKLTREEILKRDTHQFSEEKKTKLADFIILNDNSELIVPQVLELHNHFISVSHSSN